MTSAEDLTTVEVMLGGQAHQVVVSGNNWPAFGFESAAGQASDQVLLRFHCDVCERAGRLVFVPPSSNWRRPFAVRRVVHVARSDE